MILRYTGSQNPNSPQPLGRVSLGNYMSISNVDNGNLNNLFGGLSLAMKPNSVKPEYRALILLNNLGIQAANCSCWFEYGPNNFFTYQIGIITPTIKNGKDVFIDKIPNSTSIPNGVTFEDALVGTPKLLGSIPNNTVIGLWFKRTLIKDIFEEVDCGENAFDGTLTQDFFKITWM